MNVVATSIPDVLVIEPKVFGDARGFFFESFNQKAFNETTGLDVNFLQDNHSRSARGVLRGLHYQVQQPQGKLVRMVRGAVFDVAVDIRMGSPTFGKWEVIELTEDNRKQLWVPPGFAHGFVVLSDFADFYTKPRSTTRRHTNVVLLGMIQKLVLIGPSRCPPACQSKTIKGWHYAMPSHFDSGV